MTDKMDQNEQPKTSFSDRNETPEGPQSERPDEKSSAPTIDICLKNLDILFEEYKLGEEIGGKYFSYMYSTIHFTLILYGAIIAVFQSVFNHYQTSETYFLIFSYLLPVITYILGLFYAYNSVAISRQGYFMLQIEHDIKEICQSLKMPYPIHCWNSLSKSKKNPNRFILPYGTMLMFYILSPIFFYLFNVFTLCPNVLFPNACALFSYSFMYVVPGLFLLFYIIFMILLIISMLRFSQLHSKNIDPNEQNP